MAAVCLLVVAALPAGLAAREQSATFGAAAGWGGLAYSEGLARGTGRFGFESLVLSTNTAPLTQYTDLALKFEAPPRDETGKYEVRSVAPSAHRVPGIIQGQAMQLTGNGGLELVSADPRAIFGGPKVVGSFNVTFWLKPAVAESGETVLSWRTSRVVDAKVLHQTWLVTFLKNRVVWTFTNFFEGYRTNRGEITLTCDRQSVPGVWAHYAVSFDDDTGCIEYRVNGKLEAVKFITDSGHEGGTVYSAVVGSAAPLQLCPKFIGAIDDFRITAGVRSVDYQDDYTLRTENALAFGKGAAKPVHPSGVHYNVYARNGGRFETNPIYAGNGASFKSLNAQYSTPSQTDVFFFVRGGNNVYEWTDSSPEWIPVDSGAAARGDWAPKGEYFQIAAELYSDGAGVSSPSVTSVTIAWNALPPPLPPFRVEAVPADRAVTLEWTPSVAGAEGNGTVAYRIFYGERPGEYLSGMVNAGSATSFTVDSLKNGTVYYFAVAAVAGSAEGEAVVGELSPEVVARPRAGAVSSSRNSLAFAGGAI